MQYVLVELLGTVAVLHVERDLLVGEEHEVLNENLGRLLQRIFRMNRTVGSNLQIQFLVVGLLLHTIVFDRILHVLDRREDRIDGERTEFALGRGILLCGNVAAPLTDRKGDLHLGSRCEMANDQFGIQHLEERKIVRNVSCGQLRYARHVDRHLLGVLVVDRTDETDFFEIQDNIDHTLHHPRDSGKLVVYTGYFDRRNRIPLQRREQDTAQSVADGHSESRLQRSELELPER